MWKTLPLKQKFTQYYQTQMMQIEKNEFTLFFGTYRKILQEQEKNDKINMLNSFYPVLQVDI